MPERHTDDYARNGTNAALDFASGRVIAEMTTRLGAEELRRFLT